MPTINGTEGPDTLLSDTSDEDIINGLGGDDVITFDDLNSVDGTTDQANGGSGTDTLRIDLSGLTSGLIRLADPVPSAGGGFEATFTNFTNVRIQFTSIERFDITTGSGQDYLVLATGDDMVSLGGGDDFVDVGSGTNTADGGAGIDRISADLSADTGGISWNLVANTFSGPGSYTNFEVFDTITTGSGDDTLVGGSQGPTFPAELNLGAGNDSVTIQSVGAYHVYGGTGSDRLIVNYGATSAAVNAFATPNGGGGFDGTVTDNSGRVVDFFEIEHFSITTGSGNDQLTLYSGDDFASLGAGSDTVDFGTGNNSGDGGAGTDRVSVDMSAATAAISWNLQANTYSGPVGTGFTNFEYFGDVRTGSGADTIVTGTLSLSDTVRANGGSDSVTVAGGYDFVYAGAGLDTLIVDYGSTAIAITTNTGPFADGNGFSGRYNPLGALGVEYTGIDRFVITTGSGNDSIATGSGNDVVSTGAGNDTVDVGSGNDQADGGAGTDRIRADMSAATIAIVWNIQTNSYSGPVGTSFTNFESFLELFTGSGDDVIVTSFSTAPEEVVTGAGNDTVTVGGGTDFVFDNGGVDTLVVDYSANTAGVTTTSAPVFNAGLEGFGGVYTASGTGTVNYDGFDRFLITTGSGADDIVTATGNDIVSTGSGNDRLEGGGGDDFLDGGSGDDEMIGGLGNDIFVVDSAADIVTEIAGQGDADEIRTGLASYSLSALPNVERLTGTSGAGQSLTGNAAANVITGGSGNDSINGAAGDDIMLGGGGNDSYRVSSAGDSVIETPGNGNDTVLTSVSFALTAGSEIETLAVLPLVFTAINLTGNEFAQTLSGNNAANVLIGRGGADTVNGSGGDDTLYGQPGDDVLDGGTGNDRLYGGSGNDMLVGGDGDDVLQSNAGDDSMAGGAGNDIYFVNAAGDTVSELPGEGTDEVRVAGVSFTLGDNVENLRIISGAVDGTGNALANEINGSAGNNTISGLAGNDTLRGRGGTDTIDGGDGNDVIAGNGARDFLTGGAGADRFVFTSITDSSVGSVNADVITDFSQAQGDRIQLTAIDAIPGGPDDPFAFIGTAAFSGTAGELRYRHSGGDTLVEMDVDGDGVRDMTVVLTGTHALVAGDFIL